MLSKFLVEKTGTTCSEVSHAGCTPGMPKGYPSFEGSLVVDPSGVWSVWKFRGFGTIWLSPAACPALRGLVALDEVLSRYNKPGS